MRVGSLFSGIGGLDLGLERAGMEVVWQVEFDEQARSVLRRHWPNVDLHKDVCDVGSANLARVDLIVGGFPCQDLSVAGKREGLAGGRSGLWWEFHRIISELSPTWVLIENVPGLLSSNEGRDMAIVVRGLEELGYGWSYRVLDSQYFGVAQRRRRVFIVGHLGGPCPSEILLEPEGVFGDSAPSRTTRKELAPSLSARASYDRGDGSEPLVAHAVTSREAKGPNSDCNSGNVVAHTLRAEGFDASEDGTGRGTPIVADTLRRHPRPGSNSLGALAFDTTQITSKANRSNPQPGDPCHPLAAGAHAPAIAFNEGNLRRKAGPNPSTDTFGTLKSDGGDQDPRVSSPVPRRLTPTECEPWTEAEYANTLNGQGDTAGVVPLCAEVAPTLSSSGAGTSRTGNERTEAEMIQLTDAVPRRLTPTECERLQGFPDGHTEYGAEPGKKGTHHVSLKDGPRYRMLGNAVTVNVAEWIGRRIMEIQ